MRRAPQLALAWTGDVDHLGEYHQTSKLRCYRREVCHRPRGWRLTVRHQNSEYGEFDRAMWAGKGGGARVILVTSAEPGRSCGFRLPTKPGQRDGRRGVELRKEILPTRASLRRPWLRTWP